jgi:hypothetical protein
MPENTRRSDMIEYRNMLYRDYYPTGFPARHFSNTEFRATGREAFLLASALARIALVGARVLVFGLLGRGNPYRLPRG